MDNQTDKDAPLPAHQPGQVFGPSQSAPPVSPASPVPPAEPAPVIDEPAPFVAGSVPQSGMMINGQTVSYNEQQQFRPKKRSRPSKKLFIPLIAALILLGGSAAAYYGYYVPNKPENIWRTALSRMGKGYDKLNTYVADYHAANGYKIDGSFSLSGTTNADGSLSSVSDGSNGELKANVSVAGLKLGLDAISVKSTGSVPDVYLKASGLDGLGPLLDNLSPGLGKAASDINNQWYLIDHTLFEQYLSSANTTSISKSDITQALDAAAGPTKQYIFTSDPSKMAFVVKQNIGKENQDGRSVYHYKIGVNKANLSAYNKALCNSLSGTKLFKLWDGYSSTSQALQDCKDSVNVNGNETADVWVDTHTKLIHKVRFDQNQPAGNYFDIFQDYQGGNSLPFGVDYSSKSGGDSTTGSLNFNLDMTANTLTVNGSLTTTGTDKEKGSLDLKFAPNTAAVKIQKPANAKNIIQLLDDLGLGQGLSQAGGQKQTQNASDDVTRQTDINAIQTDLEVYYVDTDNGNYPSFSQLSSAAWRQANLQGADQSAFKDPGGSSGSLAAVPRADVYAYQPTPAGCNNTTVQCQHYTLTATLSTGKTFAKQSLN